jgi:hypothetical protein
MSARTFEQQRYPHNLPLRLSTFIGRERELAQLKSLLWSSRLLTLTGFGGCGKTRLALKAAEHLLDAFSDGVWLVELAPVSDPDLVPQVVAATLGLHDATDRSLSDVLIAHLQSREVLLVLDNCEHLIAACARGRTGRWPSRSSPTWSPAGCCWCWTTASTSSRPLLNRPKPC